jgi:NAD(P)-dependent dehydrogenase (short-subunit alcohol dehydrogenase family)
MNSLDQFKLEGKTAIVTGALGLLGREHCKALSEAGAVVIAADLDKKACIEFSKEFGGSIAGMELDVTDHSSINTLKNEVIKKYGKIDVLVNNAAINDMFENPEVNREKSKFENYPLEYWEKSVSVNLTGVFLCSQIIGSEMARNGKGSIINIASTYGIVAPVQDIYKNEYGEQVFFKPPAYSATKGAVIAFTKYLASYWGSSGVRVNTLSPGGVKNGQDEFFIRNYSSRTPLTRMADPTDYKGGIVFLASDASCYMTGANLVIDGGWTAW